MKTITVQVREDHLETLARTKPMAALSELIWNALDAEATEVRVEFIENDLSGLELIRVSDNGHGLHYDDAFIVFRNLGGSWKREGYRTHFRQRMLHGKFGKGRFRAFSIGNHVAWQTVYAEAGKRYGYRIVGRADRLGEFQISDARGASEDPTGMSVEIAALIPSIELLRGVKAQQEITDIFAPYLRNYPDVRIHFDGQLIDPANSEAYRAEYDLGEVVMENGERVTAALSVSEWNLPGRRGLCFCDANGFVIRYAQPKLHFRGFSYTAYLKSEHLRLLETQGMLEMEELSHDVQQLLAVARAKLREHFTLREAERAHDVIALWKEQGLYPYEGDARTRADETERRIFEIYATHLNQIFPDFAQSSMRNRRLILRLVQELVHTEPTQMARILDELLTFPEEKEEEVLELLQV